MPVLSFLVGICASGRPPNCYVKSAKWWKKERRCAASYEAGSSFARAVSKARLIGGFAVILAIPVTSAVATIIDVFVLDHEPPPQPARRRRRALASHTQ
jgi:hypothetical protein